ncbi:hypothetical protein FS749_013718 [Ceratobasidium sp. UAMH 11750]|nr:hypothetical protein FS749_013718 [Ceratobasidium sp. UAMH 11750]
MDDYLEPELRGAIFCDPNFVNNFLAADSTRLQTVLDQCEKECDAFTRPEVTEELELYEPIRRALNTIKQAVGGNPNQNHPSLFEHIHSSPIPSHVLGPEMAMPDLALFDGPTRHWETLSMPVEVKTLPTYLKVGMKQLARDAYVVFANQLHRRHLYGMVVCSWDAMFVRFDRSGILYSKPIDMSSEEFRKAFAGLMMLNDEAFGYDTAFTTRPGRNGRLGYYVDLPTAAFFSVGGSDTASDTSITGPEASNQPSISKPPTRRLKVTRTLCHRHVISGRATIVLQLREVLRPGVSAKPGEVRTTARGCSPTEQGQRLAQEVEVLGTRDHVLKLMWRDSNQRAEGEVLERLVGIYGVAQYLWYSDVFKACSSPGCARSMDSACGRCLDKTPGRDSVLVAEKLADLDIEVPETAKDGGETKYTEVKTNDYSKIPARWTPRIYCRLLTSTVGSPLRKAESPRQLLQAVLDAILGYWHLVNRGLLHRDISDGNVLILPAGHGYIRRWWEDQRAATNMLDPVLAKSEELLQDFLVKLNRDPSGMLHDFDLFAIQGGMEAVIFSHSFSKNERSSSEGTERGSKRRKPTSPASQPARSNGSFKEKLGEAPTLEPNLTKVVEGDKHIDFRVGTPVFMSIRVMEVGLGRRYKHHFMDDLESFFWLIVWCVAEHVDDHGTKPTVQAQGILDRLDQPDPGNIKNQKLAFLMYCDIDEIADMEQRLALWHNSWAKNPGIVTLIVELGTYFKDVKPRKLPTYTPTQVFPAIVDMFQRAITQTGLALSPGAETSGNDAGSPGP